MAKLVVSQLAVLLQLVQLWSVLGRLSQPIGDDLDINLVNNTEAAWWAKRKVFSVITSAPELSSSVFGV